jgi:hypothetical protein
LLNDGSAHFFNASVANQIGYTHGIGRKTMHQRSRKFVAAVAIIFCLVLLLVPHPHFTDAAAAFLLVPDLFFAIPPSHQLLSRMAYLRLGDVPDAPALPSSFQRPPPSSLA